MPFTEPDDIVEDKVEVSAEPDSEGTDSEDTDSEDSDSEDSNSEEEEGRALESLGIKLVPLSTIGIMSILAILNH